MQEVIENLLEYGYILLFFYSLGGGMIGILAAAILCAGAELDIYACISLAFLGNALGSSLLFIASKFYKKEFSPYLKKHRRKVALANLQLKKHAISVLVVSKFIYGLKTLVPIVAGIAKYNFANFLLINTLASLLWAILLGILGFVFGYFVELVFDRLGAYSYITPVFLLVLIALLWFYASKFSKK